MMHRSIDRKLRLFFYLILFLLLSTQISKNNNIRNNIKEKLNNIEVIGLSEENNFKVYESLKFLLTENIFFINEKELQNILTKNNLIDYFYVKKIYPNLIKVQIKKTEFLAVTNQNNKKFFIGSNGKLINYEFSDKNLPYVFGKINVEDFIKLTKIIAKSKFNFEEISELYFFPSGRWDIKSNKGILIKLPETNLLKALNLAHHITINEIFKNDKVIDLRIYNDVISTNE